MIKENNQIDRIMEQREAERFERDRLGELKNRLFAHEQAMKDERRKLWQVEKGLEKPTVWSELELLSTYIFGYVSQLISCGYTRQEPVAVISHLRKLSIFDVDCIANWYPTSAEEYPQIKQHFELLDYVRLLTLDFVERYRLQEKSPVEGDVVPMQL